MSVSGQPRRVFTGSERDLLDFISLLSPAQREFISNSLEKKTQEDEARCSQDLTSLVVTGLGDQVLVIGADGVFLRGKDMVSHLISDSFTFLRAMYLLSFHRERGLGDPKKWISTDYMAIERKSGEASFCAWVNTFDDGGTFQENTSTYFDIIEVRALLDSVMPSIGRLLVTVKASELRVFVEYARFPDFPVLHLVKEWKRFGSIQQMLAKHFGQVMADAATIELIDPD